MMGFIADILENQAVCDPRPPVSAGATRGTADGRFRCRLALVSQYSVCTAGRVSPKDHAQEIVAARVFLPGNGKSRQQQDGSRDLRAGARLVYLRRTSETPANPQVRAFQFFLAGGRISPLHRA